MAERPEFQRRQFEFAAHIRDPEHAPAPAGIEDRRMAVYRELFFNNLRKLLGGMFPVLRKLLGAGRWDGLIREFMREHRARTPYFLQLPREFLAFLEEEHSSSDDDPPFLVELAHYEYVELELAISEARDEPAGVDPDGDLLAGAPVRSALARVVTYRYPVHRITPGFQPAEPAPQPICLAIYRDAGDDVRFFELNPVTTRLLELIENNDDRRSGADLLRSLATEIDYDDVDALLRHGAETLAEMRQLGILTGTRRAATG
jgi:uncharacterized protein